MADRISSIFLILSIASIIFSCETNKKKIIENSSFLPRASGENREMIIVMDSSKFQNQIGRSLVNIYGSFVKSLPQPEPKFDLRYIRPRKFNNILRHAKNIVMAFTLEGKSLDSEILRKNFNAESLEKIKEDPSFFYFIRRNQYAKGQIILYLFSRTDQELKNKIVENSDVIIKLFEDEVIKRVNTEIFNKVENNISKKVLDDHKINLKIPYGYDLAKNLSENNGNFLWLRQLEPDLEKNIFVYYEDYSTNQLKDFYDVFNQNPPKIKKIRDVITRKFLRDSEKNTVFMTIQDIFPIDSRKINYKGFSAVESKGLWKLSDISAGGPFHSLIFYDSDAKRIYYVEGYIYAPGLKKRDLMQEIYSILWTFEI